MKKTPGFTCSQPTPETLLIHLSGNWTLSFPPPDLEAIDLLLTESIQKVEFDYKELEQWDSLLPLFLLKISSLKEQNTSLNLDTLPPGAKQLLELSRANSEHVVEKKNKTTSFIEKTGRTIINAFHRGRELADFTGEIILECILLLRGKTTFRFRDFFYFIQSAGADALPIISLISILVGVILAFVGAVQLKMFGAQIYVANLVGLAMVLEMGAMMSGIIMAGRTGAAYAAQLGTMQVNEEIDALKTLGISPIGFLVLPRVLALMLMLPLLCIYADILGIFGGALIGVFMLDLSFTEYFLYTKNSIHLDQCMQGLIKSGVYGILIGFAGCLRGLKCGRSASAVGEATTSAVVTSMVLIIISDAIMTFLFTFIKTR